MSALTDRTACLALALLLFALYVVSTPDQPAAGDSCELAVCAWTGRLPHPPGYGLHNALCALASGLPLGSPGWRMSVASGALPGAAAAVLLLLVARRAGLPLGAAVPAALAFGFTSTLWSQATCCEVYALEAFLVLLVPLLYLRHRERPSAAGEAALWAVATAAVVHRPTSLAMVAAVAAYATLRPNGTSPRWSARLLGLGVGLLTFAWLFTLRFENPLILGDRTLPRSLGGYAQYLSAARDAYGTYVAGAPGLHVRRLSDAWLGLAGAPALTLGLAGWLLAARRTDLDRALLGMLAGAGLLHLGWQALYEVSDIGQMLLPAVAVLALGWALLLARVPEGRLRRAGGLALVLAVGWHAAPLVAEANAPGLVHAATAFHASLGPRTVVFCYDRHVERLAALEYVNQVLGPRKDLRFQLFRVAHDSLTPAAVAAFEGHVRGLSSQGFEVYVSVFAPELLHTLVLEPAGPFARLRPR